MYLSTRTKFRKGDEHWELMVAQCGLTHVTEFRSAAPHVNDYVFVGNSAGPFECTTETFLDVLSKLPRVQSPDHYYQLGINLRFEAIPELPPITKLLGFDILNDDMESLPLSLGVLVSELPLYRERANQYGLFSEIDAREIAAKAEPGWPTEKNDPMNIYSVWAVFEVMRTAV